MQPAANVSDASCGVVNFLRDKRGEHQLFGCFLRHDPAVDRTSPALESHAADARRPGRIAESGALFRCDVLQHLIVVPSAGHLDSILDKFFAHTEVLGNRLS